MLYVGRYLEQEKEQENEKEKEKSSPLSFYKSVPAYSPIYIYMDI